MKTRIFLMFLATLFLFIKPVYGVDSENAKFLFLKGNKSYTEGKFEEAVNDYEKVLGVGLESAPLYYNLGNAYLKEGRPGKAILNYLRAERLIPEEADLKSNLNYARSLTKGNIFVVRKNWLARVFLDFARSFNLDRITVATTILYWTLAILLIFAISLKKWRKTFILISLTGSFFLVLSVSVFFIQFNDVLLQKKAVIVVQEADSKFEPLDGATTFFTLHEGDVVVLGRFKDGWIKVKRSDGKQGWIKKNDIEVI